MALEQEGERKLQDKMVEFQAVCREAGLKLTHQRLEIFKELAGTKDHPSAEMIYERVRARIPTMALDTVYRTISTLEDHGLVTRVQAFDDQGRFDAETSPHHHWICTRCRSIMDFHWPVFDNLAPPLEVLELGSLMETKVIIRGLCRKCLENQDG